MRERQPVEFHDLVKGVKDFAMGKTGIPIPNFFLKPFFGNPKIDNIEDIEKEERSKLNETK